ncbi:Fe2+-dependent dioxygenase [Roseomonas nepalensis]|uniref:Fe2+-dependent dioxygenase n=1 Tax=Muricoccus nepalensis TaxID=1854500 RepID=A0A502GFQ3_9PROT|nr:Fe2+-dependent dioxygenase [Roseomonas nepalensis]TPG60432.1 Fe2+-dependent dioxygenase [Roseomonas nepalensis]
MIVCIPNVLPPERLGKLRALLGRAAFTDGAATAGWHARVVKANEQADPLDPFAREAGEIALAALEASEVFRAAALPRRLRAPLLSRTTPGRTYGAHVDDAVMGGGAPSDPRGEAPLRADIAVTLFLSDPDSYEGGELVIETMAGEMAVRLAAGEAVAYPAGTIHRVAPVTRGERLVAATWAQSLVRDPAKREILFDLDAAGRDLFAREGKSRAFDLLAKSRAALLRRWAEP